MNLANEEWLPVFGYENIYMISNLGNVLSTRFRNNVSDFPRIKKLSPTGNGNGYLLVTLNKNGKGKNRYIHDLVAEAFIGKRPSGFVVNHIDHDRANNRADNLEWCTQKENVMKSVHLMRHRKSASKTRPAKTGEQYIYLRPAKGYRVVINGRERHFHNLDSAILYRNQVLVNGS
jgi:hypothetical protein